MNRSQVVTHALRTPEDAEDGHVQVKTHADGSAEATYFHRTGYPQVRSTGGNSQRAIARLAMELRHAADRVAYLATSVGLPFYGPAWAPSKEDPR